MDTALNAAAAGTIKVGSFTVNRMGFGAMRITGDGIWGMPPDPDKAIALLKYAVDNLAINFIDTADAYGPATSEELIARALSPYDNIVIATKGGNTRPGPNQWVPDCSPEHLKQACDASLQRLGVDQIAVYQLHTVDPKVPFMDSLQALIDLQQAGKIKHIGLSNVEPEQLTQALQKCEIVSVQNHYNLGNREHEDVLKLCEEHDIAFIPWYPLGGGELTSPTGPLAEYAQKYAVSTSQIALAWLLAHSPVMLPIPGTSSEEHLRDNLAAASLKLEPADIEALTNMKTTE